MDRDTEIDTQRAVSLLFLCLYLMCVAVARLNVFRWHRQEVAFNLIY